MTVELIRHGETALQKENRYQGSTDEPLSQDGKAKLICADPALPEVFVTSLCRTQQTAAILFPNARQLPAPGLEEMNFGIFERRNYKEMENDSDYIRWLDSMCTLQCPGGESRETFSNRVCIAFRKLIDQEMRRGNSTVVIVAHGGTQMAIMDRFARPHRDYFDWHLSSGCGYRAELTLSENELVLSDIQTTSYIK